MPDDNTIATQLEQTLSALREREQEATNCWKTLRILEERVEVRTREIERRQQIAESLRDILRAINSNLPLAEVLDCIVTEATRYMGAAACVLSRLDIARQQVVHEAMYGWPAELQSYHTIPMERLSQAGGTEYRQALERREPTYGNYGPLPDRLEEIRNDPTLSEEERARRLLIRTHFAGSMGVPLVAGDQLYGGLAFYYAEPQTFSDEQVQLALIFAEQAALAVENARLRVEVEQAAVSAERNRIARELHDSVSQALYGIALGTRTACALVDRQPVDDKVKAALANPLDYVLSLAEVGLAEMRALIFELRPDALEKEGLVAALTRLAEVARTRHKLDVRTAFCIEPPTLPLATKEALYRVAQEALNNLVKHAQASRVDLRLRCAPDVLMLEVQDNGVGFDPQADYLGHLGLHTMRERVERLGGLLEIESAPGQGCLVRARLSGQ